jgi:hypothetical protein
MPTLLPGGYVFQSGKDGNGYLLAGAALGHVSSPARQVSGFCGGGSFGGSVYDSGNSTLYVTCSSGLKALSVTAGSPPTLAGKAGFSAASGTNGPPAIAGGLVWVINKSGTIYGLDPNSGATRSRFSIPESGSDVNHFATPSAGGGKLFAASGDQVTAFTIAQMPGTTATTTSLTSSRNPTFAGSSLTLTATVAPTPDGGTITFADGGKTISGCSGIVVSTATGGRAVCNTAIANTGTHELTAAYSGDAFYAPSISPPLSQAIVGPTLTHASLTPRRFKAKHPSTLKLTLNEAATITVAITQLRRGHLIKGHCTTRAHRGKKCRIPVTLLRLHFQGRAGQNAFKLRLRKRAAGGYTAVIYATDRFGHRSRTIRITFTILSARKR